MDDKIYSKKEKPTSRKQQIMAKLAALNDYLVFLEKDKIETLAEIVELREELRSITQ